jgi:hypothetical protein
LSSLFLVVMALLIRRGVGNGAAAILSAIAATGLTLAWVFPHLHEAWGGKNAHHLLAWGSSYLMGMGLFHSILGQSGTRTSTDSPTT